jgi:hypothetical protein
VQGGLHGVTFGTEDPPRSGEQAQSRPSRRSQTQADEDPENDVHDTRERYMRNPCCSSPPVAGWSPFVA